MPLEIRELVIKATVVNGQGPSGGGSEQQPQDNNTIDEIVSKVMQIIKDKTER